MNTVDTLLDEITQCELLESCKSGRLGSCSRIVDVQSGRSLAQHQVPEPWTGDLENARIIFISSNPSISDDEDYPLWGDEFERREDFFVHRFGVGDGRIKNGMYPPLKRGGHGKAVRFWSSVRQRAFEVLPTAVPGVDYALTEVVHCKSRSEIGVREARSTCTARYLPRIIEAASNAKLLVVFGVHAARALSEVFALELDANYRFGEISRGDSTVPVVYLDHPAGGGRVKRLATALTTEERTSVATRVAEARPEGLTDTPREHSALHVAE